MIDPSKKPGKAQSGRLPKPGQVPLARRAPAPGGPPRRVPLPEEEEVAAVEGEAAVGVASPSASSSSDRAKPPQSPNVAPEDEASPAEAEEAAPAEEEAPPERPRPAARSQRARPEKRTGNTGTFKAVKTTRGASSASRRLKTEVDDDESGERPGGGVQDFKHGVSLAVKIAVFTALLVAVAMAGLGVKMKNVAEKNIGDQINQKGVDLTNLYSKMVDPLCYTAEDNDPGGPRDQAIADTQRRLAESVAGENSTVLNVMLTTDPKGEHPILDSGHVVQLTAVPVVTYTPSDLGTHDGVEIYDCKGYQGDSFTGQVRKYALRVPAASVKIPVQDRPAAPPMGSGGRAAGKQGNGSPTVQDGYVHVFVKAAEIDHVHDEVIHQIMVATLAGIGIAIILSIAVAAYLAAPLRALVEDMRVVADGKLDHKTLARSSDEIGLVAAQFNEMTRSLRAAQKLEQEKQAIEHELTIATEIQTKLLPERIPQIPGFDLFSFYLSAKEVGGDYYDFLVIDPTHLGIIVADVSGKGIPGAMVMTMVRSLLRLASHRETSPAETLKKVNRILAKDIRRGMFVTAIYAVLDVQRKWLTVASAGHNPMVLYEAKTGQARPVNPSGIALGFDKGRTFDENIREENIELKPGDRCVFYTDGVVEAMSDKQEEFSMERFTELVKEQATRSSKDFTNAVVQELEAHRGRGEQSDDITITTLKVD